MIFIFFKNLLSVLKIFDRLTWLLSLFVFILNLTFAIILKKDSLWKDWTWLLLRWRYQLIEEKRLFFLFFFMFVFIRLRTICRILVFWRFHKVNDKILVFILQWYYILVSKTFNMLIFVIYGLAMVLKITFRIGKIHSRIYRELLGIIF